VYATAALVVGGTESYELLGYDVVRAGDVNGDGYGDFLARTVGNVSTPDRVPTPRALLYFGGATLDGEPDAVFTGGGIEVENMAAAGLGDVNGDGYDDFAFAGVTYAPDHSVIDPAWVQVHLGGPSFAAAADLTLLGSAQALFGFAMAGGGDLNGDGFPDLVVGAYKPPANVNVYFGGPAMDDVADLVLTPPVSEASGFGNAVAIAGDVNGDGFDDVVVGARGGDGYPVGPPGRAYLFFGAQAMRTIPDVTFASSMDGELFGTIVAPAGT
jgi:hypothetical protein